nr:hypothetical protein [Nonomuraea sp. SBT364]
MGEDELRKEAELLVTDPWNSRRIPPHTTGGSVDDRHGNDLDMGASFDHLGPSRQHSITRTMPGTRPAGSPADIEGRHDGGRIPGRRRRVVALRLRQPDLAAHHKRPVALSGEIDADAS